MEDGVLQVVVVEGDEDGQAGQEDGQHDPEADRTRVGKGGVAHQACRVDHGEFINELRRI